MGDCDSDDECMGGLICGKQSCAVLYPTAQEIDPMSDCCVTPGTCCLYYFIGMPSHPKESQKSMILKLQCIIHKLLTCTYSQILYCIQQPTYHSACLQMPKICTLLPYIRRKEWFSLAKSIPLV